MDPTIKLSLADSPPQVDLDKGYCNRLAGSGRPGLARASRISWDRDGSDWVRPAVSRGLVVKVTRESFSKPFLWCH